MKNTVKRILSVLMAAVIAGSSLAVSADEFDENESAEFIGEEDIAKEEEGDGLFDDEDESESVEVEPSIDFTAPVISNVRVVNGGGDTDAIIYADIYDENDIAGVYFSTNSELTYIDKSMRELDSYDGVDYFAYITAEGTYYIYAADEFGNIARYTDGVYVSIDNDGPILSNAAAQTGGGNTAAQLSVDVTDNSGVKAVYYSTKNKLTYVDSSMTEMYSDGYGTYTADIWSSGKYYLYAVDVYDNFSSFRNGVDVAFEALAEFTVRSYDGSGKTEAKVVVKITNGSSIKGVYLSDSLDYTAINDNMISVPYSVNSYTYSTCGDIEYYVYVEDVWGNISRSEGKTAAKYNDNSPYIRNVTVSSNGGNTVSTINIGFCKGDIYYSTTSGLTSRRDSGLVRHMHMYGQEHLVVDEWRDMVIDIRKTGTYYLYVSDEDGNLIEYPEPLVVDHDDDAPQFSSLKISEASDGKGTTVSVKVTDKSEIEGVFLSRYNLDPCMNLSGNIVLSQDENGTYTATIKDNRKYYLCACDKWGNLAVYDTENRIENTYQSDFKIVDVSTEKGGNSTPAKIKARISAESNKNTDAITMYYSRENNKTSVSGMTEMSKGSDGYYTAELKESGKFCLYAKDENGEVVQYNRTYVNVDYDNEPLKILSIFPTRHHEFLIAGYIDLTNEAVKISSYTNFLPYTLYYSDKSGLTSTEEMLGSKYMYISTINYSTSNCYFESYSHMTDYGDLYFYFADEWGNLCEYPEQIRFVPNDVAPEILSVQTSNQLGYYDACSVTIKFKDDTTPYWQGGYCDYGMVYLCSVPGLTSKDDIRNNSRTDSFYGSVYKIYSDTYSVTYNLFDEDVSFYVYVVDWDGNVAQYPELVTIKKDRTAPTISSAGESVSSSLNGTLAVKVEDDNGVRAVYYSDRSGLTQYSGNNLHEMTAGENGIYTADIDDIGDYYIYALDNGGNWTEYSNKVSVSVDRKGPVINLISTDIDKSVLSFTVSAEDSTGVEGVYYSKYSGLNSVSNKMTSMNNIDGNLYSAEVTDTGDYYIYAVDTLGNISRMAEPVTCTMDNKAAIIKIISNSNDEYYAHTAELMVRVIDNYGISEVWYSEAEGAASSDAADGSFTSQGQNLYSAVFDKSGEYFIYAKDSSGNVSVTNNPITIKCDYDAPAVHLSNGMRVYSGMEFVSEWSAVCIDDVTFTVEARDNLSGVESISWYIAEFNDGDEAVVDESYLESIELWNEYTEGINLTAEKSKHAVVCVKAQDKAGNVSYCTSEGYVFIPDGLHLSGIQINQCPYTENMKVYSYGATVSFFISVDSDNINSLTEFNIQGYEYSHMFSDGLYYFTIDIDEQDKDYEIPMSFSDYAGNTISETIKFSLLTPEEEQDPGDGDDVFDQDDNINNDPSSPEQNDTIETTDINDNPTPEPSAKPETTPEVSPEPSAEPVEDEVSLPDPTPEQNLATEESSNQNSTPEPTESDDNSMFEDENSIEPEQERQSESDSWMIEDSVATPTPAVEIDLGEAKEFSDMGWLIFVLASIGVLASAIFTFVVIMRIKKGDYKK